jgi:hypothetical protein
MVLGLRIGTEKDNPTLHVLVGDGETHDLRIKATHFHEIIAK